MDYLTRSLPRRCTWFARIEPKKNCRIVRTFSDALRNCYIGEKNNYAECLLIAGEVPCMAAMPIRIKS
jgi:hypothetical protein